MSVLQRQWVRVVLVGVAVCIALVVGYWIFIFSLFNQMGDTLTDDDKEPVIIHLLDGIDVDAGDYAVIFGPTITGGETLLVRDQAWLQTHADSLWYKDEGSVGGFIGALAFGMMGMPIERHIATLIRDGAVVQSYSCLTVNCAGGLTSGMAALHGAVPGVPVEMRAESFVDHQTYLTAHRQAIADPERWFMGPDLRTPAPADDGMRLVVITWPTELIEAAPDYQYDVVDPQARARLQAWTEALIGETGAQVSDMSIIDKMTLWLTKDGAYVYDGAGGMVALPDISMRTAYIRLNVPMLQVETFMQSYQANPPPAADLSLIRPAVFRAFTTFGIDTECLPECGGALQTNLDNRAEISLGPDPVWNIVTWQLLAQGG